MEKLRHLEIRVEAMLEKVRTLETQNRALKSEGVQRIEDLERENRDLRAELDRERAGKQDVVSRIDNLLAKLQDDPEQTSES